jgi:hypothetical protein
MANKALFFENSERLVNGSQSGWSPTGNQWSIKLKYKAYYTGNPTNIIDFYYQGGSDSPNHSLRIQTNGKLCALMGYGNGGSGGYNCEDTRTAISWVADQWYEIYLAHDNTADKTYFGVDGVVTAVDDTGTTSINDNRYTICVGSGAYGTLWGTIDEFYCENTILHTGNYTPATSEYTEGTGTQFLFHFNEGTGTTCEDEVTSADITFFGYDLDPDWVDGDWESAPAGGAGCLTPWSKFWGA